MRTWFNNFWYITLPSRGLYAQQQVLFEDETCRVTLLNMGAYDDGDDKQDICVSLKVENLSDAFIYPRLQGLMLDGVFREASGGPTYVHPGCTTYYAVRLNHEELERAGLTSIRTAEVVMRFDRNYTILGLGGFAAIEQYPVKLSKAGTGSCLPTGGKLMFDEYDVRIYLLGYEEDDWGNDWYVLVENDSDMDIDLTAVNCIINGEKISDESFNNAAIYEGQVPDHGKTVARFSMIHFGELDLESMSFDILIYDFTQQKVLHKGNTRIELVVSE